MSNMLSIEEQKTQMLKSIGFSLAKNLSAYTNLGQTNFAERFADDLIDLLRVINQQDPLQIGHDKFEYFYYGKEQK
jgi:hypothetical protein